MFAYGLVDVDAYMHAGWKMFRRTGIIGRQTSGRNFVNEGRTG